MTTHANKPAMICPNAGDAKTMCTGNCNQGRDCNCKPLSKQVGGDHYTSMSIQPWEIMRAWYGDKQFIAYLLMTALKYLARNKNNKIEDLEKCVHCIQEAIRIMKNA